MLQYIISKFYCTLVHWGQLLLINNSKKNFSNNFYISKYSKEPISNIPLHQFTNLNYSIIIKDKTNTF